MRATLGPCRLSFLFALSLVTAIGCGGDSGGGDGDGDGDGDVDPLPDAGANDFIVNGTITGANARAGDLNGLFSVRIGQPAIHSYGLGRSLDGATFSLALPPNLPTSVLNGNTVGLATPILTEIDDSIETGQADNEDLTKIIGLSEDYMFVYRAAPFVMQYPWESEFEAGWSCGLCQRSGTGPNTLTPVDCSEVVVAIGNFETLGACNPFP